MEGEVVAYGVLFMIQILYNSKTISWYSLLAITQTLTMYLEDCTIQDPVPLVEGLYQR